MTNYTKQDYERDLQIVENKAYGSTHHSKKDKDYFVNGVTYGWQVWCDVNNKWHQELVPYDIESLDCLRDKIAMYEANQKLISVINRMDGHLNQSWFDNGYNKEVDELLEELTND